MRFSGAEPAYAATHPKAHQPACTPWYESSQLAPSITGPKLFDTGTKRWNVVALRIVHGRTITNTTAIGIRPVSSARPHPGRDRIAAAGTTTTSRSARPSARVITAAPAKRPASAHFQTAGSSHAQTVTSKVAATRSR